MALRWKPTHVTKHSPRISPYKSPLKPRAWLYIKVASDHDDYQPSVRLANSKAGIKPTTPLLAFDKENSIEFLLDFLHYLYNYYMVCALFSHAYHVTSCDVML